MPTETSTAVAVNRVSTAFNHSLLFFPCDRPMSFKKSYALNRHRTPPQSTLSAPNQRRVERLVVNNSGMMKPEVDQCFRGLSDGGLDASLSALRISERTEATARQLWNRLSASYREAQVYTDGWEPYAAVIPMNPHRPCPKSAGRTLEQDLMAAPGALYPQIDPHA
ncbi:hypothetical protein [Methylocaldum szegediense]|uniref:Transposase n=1 Tax=Methylocaldum szegediense TaxID=73780 RepID=A0ABM9HWA0_9GAMM|nr:hypothetical protein [Methylocaldum szegediense]CAI8720212.1 protein of unknown function [Methylocaldum szegediense]